MQALRDGSEQILYTGAILARRLVNVCIDLLGVFGRALYTHLFVLGVVHFRGHHAQNQLTSIRLLLQLVDPVLQAFERFLARRVVD